MPNEIEGRISITVESANAERQINVVEKSLQDLTNARIEDINAAKEMVRQNYQELIPELRAAQGHLRIAERNLRNMTEGVTASDTAIAEYTKRVKDAEANVDRLSGAVERLNAQYKSLDNEEKRRSGADSPAQNMSAVSNAAQTAATGINATGEATQKLTLRLIAAKSAARAFGVSIGRGLSTPMVQMGIIVAGVQSAIKLVSHFYEISQKENLETLLGGMESRREANAARFAYRDESLRGVDSALSALTRLQMTAGPLDAVGRLEQEQALETLEARFGKLGVELDTSTGKIKDFANALVELKKKEIEQKIADTQLAIKGNRAAIKTAQGEIGRTGTGWNDLSWWQKAGIAAVAPGTAFNAARGSYDVQYMTDADQRKMEKLNAEIEKTIKEQGENSRRLRMLREQLKLLPKEAKLTRTKIEQIETNAALRKAQKERAAVDKERAAVDKAESAALKAAETIANEQFKYRSTLQGSVESGSVEAVRLQSRMLTNTNTSPAAKAASGIQILVEQGKTLDQRLQTLSGQVNQLVASTRTTAGALTGGRQY